MLVYSDRKAPLLDDVRAPTNAEFFEKIVSIIKPNRPAILLAGGSDFASWTARVQQAVLRFDRRPSSYSHAALICEWDPAVPGRSWGLEVDPIRVAATAQRPEHAGVTLFRVADYFDTDAFPNLAVIDVEVKRLDQLMDAARNPLRDAQRYPLMRWLAVWRAFVTAPEGAAHPLLNRLPHPGAAFIAMAYEAAEITLIPGATDLQHCPELLWGNAKHWGHAVDQDERTRIFRVERDEAAATRKALTVPIEVPTLSERSSKT